MQRSWRHGFRPDSLAPRNGERRWLASVQAPADAVRWANAASAVVAAVPALASTACLPLDPAATAHTVPASAPRGADSGDVLANAECAALRRTVDAFRWNS